MIVGNIVRSTPKLWLLCLIVNLPYSILSYKAFACNDAQLNGKLIDGFSAKERIIVSDCQKGCILDQTSEDTDTTLQARIFPVEWKIGEKVYFLELLLTNGDQGEERTVDLLSLERISLINHSYKASTTIGGKRVQARVNHLNYASISNAASLLQSMSDSAIMQKLLQPLPGQENYDEFFVYLRLSDSPVIKIASKEFGFGIEHLSFHQTCYSFDEPSLN